MTTRDSDLLRRFTRSQRERRTRAELGLPSRNGHKVSQEDLAELTGFAVSTVGVFERGGMRHPGPELLNAYAAALRMSALERKFLWLAATGTAPPTTVDCRRMWAEDPAITRMIDDAYPDPSWLIDPAWRVLQHNQGFPEWLAADLSRYDHNYALWIFTAPHARHVFAHWRQVVTPSVIRRLRATHAAYPRDQIIARLVNHLCAQSAWARRLWRADPDVSDCPRQYTLRAPGRTDPRQAGDVEHQVTVNQVVLTPPEEGDERCLITFLLPRERQRPGTLSERACAACARMTGGKAA